MKCNIIRELIREKNKTDAILQKTPETDDDYEFLTDKLSVIKELLNYVYSYTWVKQDRIKEKIKFFIESGFDYELYCKTYDVSYESARNSVKYAYGLLIKKIGENTVSLIKNDYIDEARAAFYSKTGRVTEERYISKGLIDILPEEKFSAGIPLEDCRNELIMLSNMSMFRLNRYKEVMDKDKMAYVLHLLVGSSKRADLFRPYMMAYLNNRLTYEELLKAEEDILNNHLYA